VSAAAALLIAQNPGLKADQVASLLERSAEDLNSSTGCSACPPLRDALSGWGRLDIASALTALTKAALPAADRFETNDDVRVRTARLAGTSGKVAATLDYWDDETDIYPVDLPARRRLSISVAGAAGTSLGLRLWSPQTRSIAGASIKELTVARTTAAGAKQRFTYVVPARKGGRYYVQVAISKPGAGAYTLRWTRR
jgi:hypothetical protein